MISLLPLDVSRHFLFEWLEIKNICFLDTAFCNKLQRRLFLNILNECIARPNILNECIARADTDLFLKWTSKRNISVESLCVNNWKNGSVTNYYLGSENGENNRNLILTSLKFHFEDRINFKNFNESMLLDFFNKTNFKNLIKLEFSTIGLTNAITDKSLFAVANICVNLKTFILGSCQNRTENGLIASAKKCLKLEEIDMNEIFKLTDLKTLSLVCCRYDYITDDGIVAIATHCFELEILELSTANITDVSLIAISFNLFNIKKLLLGGCAKITDNGVILIAKNCLKLKEIKLMLITNITDLSLFEISKYCSNLEFLEISNCTKITDDGLIAAATKCLKLKVLSCGFFSDDGGVKVTLKNLHEIIIPIAIKKKIKNLIK
jgi:hypothetical protein